MKPFNKKLYKQFLAFVKKECFHIFRDKRTILILLGIPVIQIILFGFALSNEVKNARIAVLAPSKDAATAKIIEKIDASQYFDVAQILNSPSEISPALNKGDVSIVMIFSENFEENLYHTGNASIQFIVDASDPNYGVTLTNYASSIIRDYQQEILAQQNVPFRISSEVKMLYNPQMKSAYNFVPGVMGLILMLICAMMTSLSIVREKEMGTMEVLLVSPMRPLYVIISKAVPYMLLSMVNLATILLLSVFVLKVPISGNLILLILLSLLFILVSLALGLLISGIVNNQIAAMIISGVGLMMPVMVLSGMIFPTESMPQLLQWISCIIPARWYIAGVKKIMIEGLPLSMVWKEFTILGGMAIVLLTASLKRFKVRLE